VNSGFLKHQQYVSTSTLAVAAKVSKRSLGLIDVGYVTFFSVLVLNILCYQYYSIEIDMQTANSKQQQQQQQQQQKHIQEVGKQT